jgi:hypothetical protein
LICLATFLGGGAPQARRWESERRTSKTRVTSAPNSRENLLSSLQRHLIEPNLIREGARDDFDVFGQLVAITSVARSSFSEKTTMGG